MSEKIEVVMRVRLLVDVGDPTEDDLECIEEDYDGDLECWQCDIAEYSAIAALRDLESDADGNVVEFSDCDILNCG